MKKHLFFILLIAIISIACSSDDTDSSSQDPNNNEPPKSDLRLSKTVNNTSPFIGDDIIFTLTVSNSGPDTATGVLVKDILPTGYSYLNDNGLGLNIYNETTGIWTVPNIPNGSSETLLITATINESGNYTNIAEIIAADLEDPDSTPNNGMISEDDQDEVVTTPISPSTVQITTYATGVNGADGLAIDNSGNLYASNYNLNNVYKIDTNQNVSPFLNGQSGAAGMVFDNGGFMYLARYSSFDIAKISSDGSSVEVYANAIAAPIAVDFDSNGNLYTNNNENNAITKIDALGNKTIISTTVLHNSSLTLDDNDDIYISDYTSGIIKKVDGITNAESVFTDLPVLNAGGISFIVYSDGYFYATSISDNIVFMIDIDGNSEIIAGIQGVAGETDGNGDEALLNGPNGIVASADGETLYVAHTGKIRMITGYR